jgi:drug/metabolite transporter (DMT)-like permease
MISAPAARADVPSVGLAAPLLPKLAPGIFLLLWSGGFVIGKIGVKYSEPFTLLTARYALVLAILLPVFAILRPPLPARRMDWFHLSAVGLFFQAGYFCFCYAAFSAGASAGVVAIISSLNPIFVALLAPSITGEGRVTGLRWAGLALGLIGATLVIVAKSSVELTSVAGVALAFGCVISMTTGTLWEKRFGVSHHPVTANLIQYSVGLAVTAPLAYAFEGGRIEWSSELIYALAYLVLANSLLAVTLLIAMLRRGDASRVSALFFLVPPTAAVLAWAVLGEDMPLAGWIGMALAAFGVALALQKSRTDVVL